MNKVAINLSDFKAAIFDMDGTMVNNMAYHKKAWRTFLSRHGVEVSEEEFRKQFSGRKNDEILEAALGRGLDPDEAAVLAEEKESMYREIYQPHIREVAGLKEALAILHKRDIKTAIATTAPAKNRAFVLNQLGLEDQFQIILGDEHVSEGKPHPEIYLATAQMLGVVPESCIVFEDSPSGVASAKQAGMTVVGILSSHTNSELMDADYVADDFSALILS